MMQLPSIRGSDGPAQASALATANNLNARPRQYPTIVAAECDPASDVTTYTASSLQLATLSLSQQLQQQHQQHLRSTDSALSAISRTRAARKPSPGLAARLKALGFGSHNSRKEKLHAQTTDSIGRIPAEKIDHLDLLTRANSTQSVVQRRGRAWSGTGGRLPPKIIGDSSTGFTLTSSNSDVALRGEGEARSNLDDETAFLDWDPRVLEVRARRDSSVGVSDESAMIAAHDAHLDMDPHKYRLPDHINGNGTKAMPDTRRAHLERQVSWPDDDIPPPPISKDSPPPEPTTPTDFSTQVQSYFNPFGLQRAGSIYTLSRVSFANQLAQLTSLQLPDAGSLATRVSAIPTSQAAIHALMSAAEQIRSWISKASDVLGGLDADDDVEWAAAGGREGLEEVDNAITRFDQLVNVYVSAIEELQIREDIGSVSSNELQTVVTQVENILGAWETIRKTLDGVKAQVEIAMEWEELWNVVLGDIGNEMDTLSRLVFEMEERRHKAYVDEAGDVNIGDLETIVEDTPPAKTRLHANSRLSINAGFPMSPNSPNTPSMAQDDSTLLALFARMQPLRASLDFLPMRLSTFHSRASETFPTACEELETRNDGLENSWQSLEKDAESLRRELGEDRWVLVFRGAGRQAQKMYESVDRSLQKLKEAIDMGGHLNNPGATGKKIESYESKKMHYGPAIERVLQIIEKGVQDRLTVNGEIIRLHLDMQNKWADLKAQMHEIDVQLEEIQADRKNQQLRDSISSLMSNDRSTVGSLNDTPGSSPASSVIMSSLEPNTPIKNNKLRPGLSHLPQPSSRRNLTPNSASSGGSTIPRKSSARLSSYGFPSPSPSARADSVTPAANRLPRPSIAVNENKPRWRSSFRPKADTLGLTFNELQLTSPSPYAKTAPPLTHQNRGTSASMTPAGKESKLPLRSPLSGSDELTPRGNPTFDPTTPSKPAAPPRNPSRLSTTPRPSSRLGYQTKITTPGPYSQAVLSQNLQLPGKPREMRSQASTGNLASSRRTSYQPTSLGLGDLGKATVPTRPASSMASRTMRPGSGLGKSAMSIEDRTGPSAAVNKRSSLLPAPRGRPRSRLSSAGGGGRDSALGGTREGSAEPGRDASKKPTWR